MTNIAQGHMGTIGCLFVLKIIYIFFIGGLFFLFLFLLEGGGGEGGGRRWCVKAIQVFSLRHWITKKNRYLKRFQDHLCVGIEFDILVTGAYMMNLKLFEHDFCSKSFHSR